MLLILAFLFAHAHALELVSRVDWGARAPISTEPLDESPTPFVVIHHGATSGCTTKEVCIQRVRSYQNYHMDTHHWVDIGYNFIIGEDGNAYVGRGWENTGAHAPSYNNRSIGICIIGNFNDILPNAKAVSTLHQLIAYGLELGKILPDYQLLGHRQVRNTQCPGDKFYDLIKTFSHWTADPVDPYLTTTTTTTSPLIEILKNSSKSYLEPIWIRIWLIFLLGKQLQKLISYLN